MMTPVHPLIDMNRAAVIDLCRQFHVQRLEIFGSAVAGTFETERSDLDFLVVFADTPHMNRADQYFGLLFALEALFQRRIDLVEPEAIRNRFFRKAIDQTRVLLYAA